MRFAETSGSRAMIVIGALGTLALAAATWECEAPVRKAEVRQQVRPMRGCNQGRPRVATPPVAEVKHNGHADTLIAARDALTACMRDQTIAVRLALDINPAGRVTSIEVKALTNDFAKLDLHVVKCLDSAASPLVFPRGDAAVRISTHLPAQR